MLYYQCCEFKMSMGKRVWVIEACELLHFHIQIQTAVCDALISIYSVLIDISLHVYNSILYYLCMQLKDVRCWVNPGNQLESTVYSDYHEADRSSLYFFIGTG